MRGALRPRYRLLTEFDAVYYDGKTSTRNPVRVRARSGYLQIIGDALSVDAPLGEVRIEGPAEGARRVIQLPGGAQLHTDDESALEALFPSGNRLDGWLDRNRRHALTALVAFVVFSVWFAIYGLPLAAQMVTRTVTVETESALGEQTLNVLDESFCVPSKLEAERQRSLHDAFATLTAGLADAPRYRLELRACKRIGPNAFALPGATIVLTDALVELAQNPSQLTAVMAHEMGHIHERHALRQMLHSAGVPTLIAASAGHARSIADLAVALPALLLQGGYSRDFEDDADAYVFQRLKELGIPPKEFAEILKRLDDPQVTGRQRKYSLDYSSTHPVTARRIERALGRH